MDKSPTAFPAFAYDIRYNQMMPQGGMTLRDYFAAAALNSFRINIDMVAGAGFYAERAYQLADAMLKEREK